MLCVLFSYLYLGITTFLLGFGVRLFVKKYLNYEIKEVTSLVYAGLGVAAVYAGMYSLFAGVSLEANIGMLLICGAVVWMGKIELYSFLKQQKDNFTIGKGISFVIILGVFAYGGSRGYLHFDSGLYHAQAIRWIEEYGVVPGLANLHCRLDITAVPLF